MAFIRRHFVQSHNTLMDDEGEIQVLKKEWELKKEEVINMEG